MNHISCYFRTRELKQVSNRSLNKTQPCLKKCPQTHYILQLKTTRCGQKYMNSFVMVLESPDLKIPDFRKVTTGLNHSMLLLSLPKISWIIFAPSSRMFVRLWLDALNEICSCFQPVFVGFCHHITGKKSSFLAAFSCPVSQIEVTLMSVQ